MNNFIQCLSAFVACIGFSLIFRIHHQLRFVLVSSFGGALGWLVFLLFNNFNNELVAYFIAMTIVSLFSEIAARIFKAPATIFLQGNTALFIDSFIHTIAISASLALAIMIVSTIFKVIKKFSKYSLKVNL